MMSIKVIYDNGGITPDRYTVYYDDEEQPGLFSGRGMNGKPFSPQGIGMWITGKLGEHNGKEITFNQLPHDCKTVVLNDLKEV